MAVEPASRNEAMEQLYRDLESKQMNALWRHQQIVALLFRNARITGRAARAEPAPTALQFTLPTRHGTEGNTPPVGGRVVSALRWPDDRARSLPRKVVRD